MGVWFSNYTDAHECTTFSSQILGLPGKDLLFCPVYNFFPNTTLFSVLKAKNNWQMLSMQGKYLLTCISLWQAWPHPCSVSVWPSGLLVCHHHAESVAPRWHHPSPEEGNTRSHMQQRYRQHTDFWAQGITIQNSNSHMSTVLILVKYICFFKNIKLWKLPSRYAIPLISTTHVSLCINAIVRLQYNNKQYSKIPFLFSCLSFFA